MADHMKNKQVNTRAWELKVPMQTFLQQGKKKANLHVNLSDVIVKKYTIVLHFT